MSLNDLEKILQIKFKNKKILEKSLIHKSLDPINNNCLLYTSDAADEP